MQGCVEMEGAHMQTMDTPKNRLWDNVRVLEGPRGKLPVLDLKLHPSPC